MLVNSVPPTDMLQTIAQTLLAHLNQGSYTTITLRLRTIWTLVDHHLGLFLKHIHLIVYNRFLLPRCRLIFLRSNTQSRAVAYNHGLCAVFPIPAVSWLFGAGQEAVRVSIQGGEYRVVLGRLCGDPSVTQEHDTCSSLLLDLLHRLTEQVQL